MIGEQSSLKKDLVSITDAYNSIVSDVIREAEINSKRIDKKLSKMKQVI